MSQPVRITHITFIIFFFLKSFTSAFPPDAQTKNPNMLVTSSPGSTCLLRGCSFSSVPSKTADLGKYYCQGKYFWIIIIQSLRSFSNVPLTSLQVMLVILASQQCAVGSTVGFIQGFGVCFPHGRSLQFNSVTLSNMRFSIMTGL